MIKYNEPEIGDNGTLYSWSGEDKGGAYSASVFIPTNGDSRAHLHGAYDDGHGKVVDASLPLTVLQGMWHLHQMHKGVGFKMNVQYGTPDDFYTEPQNGNN